MALGLVGHSTATYMKLQLFACSERKSSRSTQTLAKLPIPAGLTRRQLALWCLVGIACVAEHLQAPQ